MTLPPVEIAALRADVRKLMIWPMAISDVVERFIAYAALAEIKPDRILLHFSSSGDRSADALFSSGDDLETIAERMRQEKYSLIAYGRSLIVD
jgi:hypothetical protein